MSKLFKSFRKSLSRRSHKAECGDRSFPPEQEMPLLLDRLGGMIVLRSIVNEYCQRVVGDPKLTPFFEGVDPRVIKAHQVRFFQMAFTKIDLHGASAVIRAAHQRLFSMGLCHVHFDLFCKHVRETLQDRGFSAEIVEEALGIIAPLRLIFEMEADLHRTPSVQTVNTLLVEVP